MKKQAVNPYLPLNVYIPDGEPHVFGDRVYVYGSHDAEGGNDFCVLDYEVWSAPVDDLSDWSCPGTAYSAKQDPDWTPTRGYAMYAPDCVQGNDGRYYLYYALAGGGLYTGPIHVAVSDHPDGPFQYHGSVRNPDGSPMTEYITFDPAVINDNGIIRLYYGTSIFVPPERIPRDGVPKDMLRNVLIRLFDKKDEEISEVPSHMMWANTVELEADMLTIRHHPRRIVPGQLDAAGTSFENHAFHEASSIRKIGGVYYFIYSSQHQHELCYAVSKYPDRDFVYGGIIVDNGDISYQGRIEKDRIMMTGNNHGSIEQIGGQWYVFYHRQTHRNTFSRQGCAERIDILPDGRIPQVEITSCGLNGCPLAAKGSYPASICCCLTNGHMPHIGQHDHMDPMPVITHDGEEHFLSGITDGTLVGYKFFSFNGSCTLNLICRGTAEGVLKVRTDEESQGIVSLQPANAWTRISLSLHAAGKKALYLSFQGIGMLELKELIFE